MRQGRTGTLGSRAQVGIESAGRGGVYRRLFRRAPGQKLPAVGGGRCGERQGPVHPQFEALAPKPCSAGRQDFPTQKGLEGGVVETELGVS